MITTSVYEDIKNAYLEGYRFIILKGGTRASKTFSILQINKRITELSKKKRIITTVSHSLPHLETGAIRDFDNILSEYYSNIDDIRIKKPYIYYLNKCLYEFIGFDRLGKSLGAGRHILHINEANYLSFSICHQLIQRTEETIFIDYNPSHEFWVDEEGYSKRDDAIVINATFYQNIQNLTQGQIDELKYAQQKAIEEEKNGKKGYWWNWWRVYGLGLEGQIEGAILSNWEKGKFDDSLPYVYGEDFGIKHYDALVKCAVDKSKKRIYWKEEIFMNGLSTDQLYEVIKSRNVNKKLIIADSASARTIKDLKKRGLNIRACVKDKITEDIKLLMDYTIIVDPDSINLIRQLNNWTWLDRKGEVPADEDDDLIDAGRYGTMLFIRPKTTPKGQRAL